MMVTKARKIGCSMVIVHHTGKNLKFGPDGVPTWRGSYDMATRLDKTICLLPCQSSLDGYVTFQVLEGKSRRGQRISLSIQLNPFDRKWELFDESSTEDRHQLVMELLKRGYVAKYEDLKDRLAEYSDLLEQLATAYESLSIDLVELGEVDLEEILEQASHAYAGN